MSLFDRTQTGWRRLRRRPGQSVAVPLMLASLCAAGTSQGVMLDPVLMETLRTLGYLK